MSGARPSDRLALLALALLVAAGAVVTGAWFWARGSVQEPSGNAPVAGLSSRVVVHFDRFGIPHVFADTEADAFRAQGFLHASDRLWQLELLRRTAQGRLAELFGEPALAADRLARTLDLWGAAARGVARLPPAERRLLDAYVNGVNAGMDARSGPLPPEFLLLRVRPQPWDATASFAIGKLMALDLSGPWRAEIGRMVAADVLPPEKLRHLSLPYPEWGPTITDPGEDGAAPAAPGGPDAPRGPAAASGAGAEGGSPEPWPVAGVSPEAATAGPAGGAPARVERAAWDPLRVLSAHALTASNAWAVAGVRTLGGHPLLANDMHLSLRAPSTWYLTALHAAAERLNVAGLSLPGVPGIVVGTNREIAWGFTNGMVDDADFAVEAVNLDGSAYRRGDRWEDFAARPETIRVRGWDAPVVHRVRETVRGPLVSDALPEVGVALSLLWAGHRPTTEFEGLLAMNRAEDPDAFEVAVGRFTSPHQNVIWAAVRGAIGYRLSGSVPRRDFDGSVPVSFERVGDGWPGFWEPEAMPALRDPAAGFLASANNLQARELDGVLGSTYPLPFRARRIVDRLRGELAWTVDRARRLQLDTRTLMADRVLPRAVAAAVRAGEEAAGRRLAEWDRSASIDSPEATLFHIWLYRLRDLLVVDEFEGRERWAWFPDAALLAVLEEGGGPWADDVRTDTVETLEGLEERAMRDALALWGGRAWGDVHHERSTHPLGLSPWLDRLFGFHVGPYPAPGGLHTVRPADPLRGAALDGSAWRPPFLGDYGPSQRFVAELRPGRVRGWFLLPTGQSGNPFSPHYRDMAERWESSRLIPLPLYREEVRARTVRTLRLLPS